MSNVPQDTMPDDLVLLETFLAPIRICTEYVPAFGSRALGGLTLSGFRDLYGADSFYSWIGLDDPLMYAAHKASGGITSIYRQVGVGSERLVRRVIKQSLKLTDNDIDWSYSYTKPDGRSGTHILDAKIQSDSLHESARERFNSWLQQSSSFVAPSPQASDSIGAVLEIRQGYKSADSKRQNADLRFGMRAYQARFLPVFAILSSQVSDPVIRRYRSDGMLVLTGLLNDDPQISTFAFFQHVVGYDLAGFFARNSERIKSELRVIIRCLLNPA